MKKKVVLAIFDGYGVNKQKTNGNAIKQAKTPNMDFLTSKYPNFLLKAHGEFVGLLPDQMGNSEVGHLTIGAGRIVKQKMSLINDSISNSCLKNTINLFIETWQESDKLKLEAVKSSHKNKNSNRNDNSLPVENKATFFKNDGKMLNLHKQNKKSVHLIGLCSDGGIHSHINHLIALLQLINYDSIYIHAITDGRDTSPFVSINYLHSLLKCFEKTKKGKLSTISGRFFTMDRDKNFDRIDLAFDTMTENSKNSLRNLFYTKNDLECNCYHFQEIVDHELNDRLSYQMLYNKLLGITEKIKNNGDENTMSNISLNLNVDFINHNTVVQNIFPCKNKSSMCQHHEKNNNFEFGSIKSEIQNNKHNEIDKTQINAAEFSNGEKSKDDENYKKQISSSIISLHICCFKRIQFMILDKIIQFFTSTNDFKLKKLICNDLIQFLYQMGYNDENIPPISLSDDGIIKKNDLVIFTNFRADRMRQIVNKMSKHTKCITMTEYDNFNNVDVIFKQTKINNTLAEILSKYNYTQTHIAETEKYAHVTYFLNGYNEVCFHNEKRILIDSKKVKSHDEDPSMRTNEICEKVIDEINNNTDFIIFNFASPDMVGHTGNLKATVEAVEIVDRCIGKIYNHCKLKNYTLFITADHGNAEVMLDTYGNISKTHTKNQVPFVICDENVKIINNISKKSDLSLSSVAPTILTFLNIPIPDEMCGISLIEK